MSENPFKLGHRAVFKDIGKGDVQKGIALWGKFYLRLMEARKKHPQFATGSRQAVQVISCEMAELAWAQKLEGRERQVDEALDVMATCARFILGEHMR